ncbi:MAG: SDR family oxidoreductase [Verrucomicrobiota bacterium]
MKLKDKVALITGGGNGIGMETARLFTREGARVALVDVNEDAGRSVAAAIEKDGGEALFVKADVSSSADCERMVAATEERFGRLDILFNNAGIMHGEDGDSEQTEESIWDLTMNINLKGVFLGCKYGIPALKRAGGGSVINTASFVALIGAATPQIAYTASKGGVLAMTRELAVIHAREKIRVNALCPVAGETPLLKSFMGEDTPEMREKFLSTIPLGRFSTPEDLGNAACYLCSDEASMITGVCMEVDGGRCI